MSYRQTYHAVITGAVSGSVSYPRSESGGSTSVTLRYSEPVTIYIDVDTKPVDLGIAACRNQLDVLEDVIREGAEKQALEKVASTRRIVKATVEGFSSLVFSEIDQKLVALHANIEAASALLLTESREVAAREAQFTRDYERLKERYASLFNTLNNELDRRIRALDEPVFKLVRTEFRDRISQRMVGQPARAALYSAELAPVHSLISSSLAKRRILDLLASIRAYLGALSRTRTEMAHVLMTEPAKAAHELALPVIFVEKDGPEAKSVEIVAIPSPLAPQCDPEALIDDFSKREWVEPPRQDVDHVEQRYLECVDSAFDVSNPVHKRTADLMVQLLKDNPWQTAR